MENRTAISSLQTATLKKFWQRPRRATRFAITFYCCAIRRSPIPPTIEVKVASDVQVPLRVLPFTRSF